ncbi:sugar phosphate isomerase/epimerase family protein [Candidatus Latescibacterota bacterium]
MKVGLYASMFGQTPEQFPDIESYIDYAYELRLDVIDLRSDRGFHSHDTDYLMATKTRCLEKGLAIGYLASGGHFVGTEGELEEKLERVRADVRAAALLGAPLIRLFCGQPLEDREAQKREVACLQRACDLAAEQAVAVGLQNHPSTGDDILRLLEETARDNFSFLLDTGQWVGSPARSQGVPDPEHDIYRFMEQTAAHATHVRAKFYKIDSGEEEWLDYPRIIDILEGAGYNGTVSVVFEGKDANDCDDRQVLRLAAAQLRSLTS